MKEILILAAIAVVLIFVIFMTLKAVFKRVIKHPLKTLLWAAISTLVFAAAVAIPITQRGADALSGVLGGVNKVFVLDFATERGELLGAFAQLLGVRGESLYIKTIGFVLPQANITLAAVISYTALYIAYLIIAVITVKAAKAICKRIKARRASKRLAVQAQSNTPVRQTAALNPYDLRGYYGPIIKDGNGNYRRA